MALSLPQSFIYWDLIKIGPNVFCFFYKRLDVNANEATPNIESCLSK